jgi:O-acetyl-ADP-ribose deacetylase (regulator of RNase III)
MSIKIVKGNIANYPHVQAIVNAANPAGAHGSGVCGAIFEGAGPKWLTAQIKKVAPFGIPLTQCVATEAGMLPNEYIIHAVGPDARLDFPAHTTEYLLSKTYGRCFELAENMYINSIALPLLGTGVYQIPVKTSLEAFKHEANFFGKLDVHLVLFDDKTLNQVKDLLSHDQSHP